MDASNFFSAHPMLVYEVAGHALAHALYSYARRGRNGKLNRREMRKEFNRKRRYFINNIMLQHKRIHKRNREVVVENARSAAIARRKGLEKGAQSSMLAKEQDASLKWRNAVSLRDKGAELRGRVDARRLRARSRWLTVMKAD